VFPTQGKISEDLRSIGIVSIHEIIETPWRIFYKIEYDTVFILSILDGRRNIEEILYKKVIEGTLQ
jgi:toxin ParE1/3/4